MSTIFMDNPYRIQVDGSLDFQLSKDEISALDLIKNGDGSLHLLKDGISYHIQISKVDPDNRYYTVSVNGTEHKIAIKTPLDELISDMGFATNGLKDIDSIAAPMPGLILDISVEEGQEVKDGDQLIVLEAMKMENIITSPRNGTIKKIAVSQSDAVEKAQLLIEFE
ncbi:MULTISPECIES: acetyl-CoA carboxylase biotin carboxyl carrier protein subunit [Flavobacteriaceae]|uniref:acetyl-CoA carboxylase biotin carboxyl carrier protein subunit n=1 Tax=Flavobacteriaceae TaxID=49546 RepID=UPI001492848E|nr:MULTISPECIES: acetyl-CoA carboxylase biotin carboxyl carrier protein subunit [Allomuricauda]MDC6367570.1 acetyl-CoA carboxylase biotin carboxyl carrier protein subunit [Muricauda sp. AC10]